MTAVSELEVLHWESRKDDVPGWWEIGPRGAVGWHRQIGDRRFLLPAGRGPGSYRRTGSSYQQVGGWWPAEFKFDPFKGAPLAQARPEFQLDDRGWPRFTLDGTDVPLLKDARQSGLPPGASRLATGGFPARTVALDVGLGFASWWDPADQRWKSFGDVVARGRGRLLGTPDGVLLLGADGYFWLIADHSEDPVHVVHPDSGTSAGSPWLHRCGKGRAIALWPDTEEGGIWSLSLPLRVESDEKRYQTFPELIPCPGLPAQETWGSAVSDRDDHSILAGSQGFVRVTSDTGGALCAEWRSYPEGFRGLPLVRPWCAADGALWIVGQMNDRFVAISDRGGRQELPGLCSVLGPHAWRARDHLPRGPWSQGAGVHLSGWFHPLAELGRSTLGLLFEDALDQATMLTGAIDQARRCELAVATSGSIQGLQQFLDVADLESIQVCTLGERLAIAIPGEGKCITFSAG